MELNIATFSMPLFETVAIKFAGLYPEQLLIKLILNMLYRVSNFS
jgi:hypothetical protein